MIQNIYKLGLTIAIPTVLLLNACSNEETITNTETVTIADAQINITVERFGSNGKNTRTVNEESKPDTIVLENGQRAIMTITEDEPEDEQPLTRAIISDGHYTIYACDASTGTRITGGNKLLRGTVTNGKFVRDADSPRLSLSPGTYTFVCFNDAVDDKDDHLEVNNINGYHISGYTTARPDLSRFGRNAMIGTTTATISGDELQLSFIMRHQNARMRVRYIAYTDQMDCYGYFATTQNLPYARSYSSDASTSTVISTMPGYGEAIAAYILPATSTTYNKTYVQAHDFYSDYSYVTPGMDMDQFHPFYTNTIYGTTFSSTVTELTSGRGMTLTRNHSYTITLRILPEALYLFEDGTVGALSDKGSRTPIGVVAKEKTNTQEGTAAALDIIIPPGGNAYPWEDVTVTGHTYDDKVNKTTYAELYEGQNDMNGYNWTWDAGSTLDNVVRAEEQAKYPAFYMAGHYQPSVPVTGSNVGKWYIPALGEVIQLFKYFNDYIYTYGPSVSIPSTELWRGYVTVGNYKRMDNMLAAFTTVNSSIQLEQTFLWTSTISDASGSMMGYWPVSYCIRANSFNDKIWVVPFGKDGGNFYILPFVHF